MSTLGKIIHSLAFASITLTAQAGPDKDEQPMPLTEMPAAVQKTIRENLRGGAVVKTEKERHGTQSIYEAIVARGAGERFALEVDPEGKLLKTKRGTASDAE